MSRHASHVTCTRSARALARNGRGHAGRVRRAPADLGVRSAVDRAPWTARAPLGLCPGLSSWPLAVSRYLGVRSAAARARCRQICGRCSAPSGHFCCSPPARRRAVGLGRSSLVRLLAAASAFVFLLSHVWLISPTRALGASAWAREVLPVVRPGFVLLGSYLVRFTHAGPATQVLVTAAGVAAFLLLRPLMRRLGQLLFAPQRGALLLAIERIERSCPGDQLSRTCGRVSAASAARQRFPEAAPLMFSFGPPAKCASMPRVSRDVPSAACPRRSCATSRKLGGAHRARRPACKARASTGAARADPGAR